MNVVVRLSREEAEELFSRVLQSAEPDNVVTMQILRKLAESLAACDAVGSGSYLRVA